MINAFKTFLVFLGKPLFYLLTNIFFFPVLLINVTSSTLRKIYKPNLKKKFKKKVKFQKKEHKEIGISIKLEELHLHIVFLKIVAGLKKRIIVFIHKPKRKRQKANLALLIPLIFILVFILAFYFSILKGLPSPKELSERSPEVSTKIYDRNGNLLYKIYKNENRTIIPLSQIPQNIRFATLAAEDAEFYNHPGFSIRGITRAIVRDIKTGSLQGGSTITQQLVKNVLLSPEKTVTRKIKELILSIEAEAIYSKDEIFEMYLNEVSYGGTAYGIQEASESYFGKEVRDLSLAEASLLAGLPKSPTTFSPFGSNPDYSFERQKEVLRLMVINKFITQEQADQAMNEKITFASQKTEIKAPHFVMYVRQLLVDKYGEEVVEKGGLEVKTSLDLPIQEVAEKIVKSEVDSLARLRVGNGAALVIDPQTGEILAMVGSKNYFDTKNDGNVNVLTSLRQPGSSIKVINYAYALSHGYTSASIIDDSPITYRTAGTTPYSPVNYDGKFKGKVSLRTALAESRNIPAVKVLASYGVQKMIELGRNMGINTWEDPSKYGLSLTLGGGSVKAIELAKVYSTLANSGKTPELTPILEVKNFKGQVLEESSPKLTQSIDERVAFLLTDILKDNNARAAEFGFNSSLVIKDHPEVAVKTGTSNNLRDNWTIGYNQNYLVLTWVGNNDNSPMSKVASGVTGASPIWNKIMTIILNGQPSIDWNAPKGVSKVNICSITGTLPCEGCPTKQEWFLDENRPSGHCVFKALEENNQKNKDIKRILDEGANTIFIR